MKAVAEFEVDFAGVVPVEAAEGLAVVEIDAAVGYVHEVERGGEGLPEVFAQSEVEGGVAGKMVPGIRLAGKSVAETRSVIDVGRGVGAPWKSYVASEVQRV